MRQQSFPKDFLWGASTSAYQVEGGADTQWSEWEQANAQRQAREAELYLKAPGKFSEGVDWDLIGAKATDPANYICGAGVDHYHRYEEDFKLLKSLNLNSLRFGIEWSRLQPEPGVWDKAAVAHYHRYIAKLKELGIEPILTLWHWTMPTWFTDLGGFEKKANFKYFYDYVERASKEFGGEVDYVLTLNEPNVYTSISYMQGLWPPQHKTILRGLKLYRDLAEVHRESYRILKRDNPDLKVSVAMNMAESQPTSPRNPWNRSVVRLRDYAWNWWYLNRVRRQLDFIGINFYNFSYVDWKFQEKNPLEPRNDLGWYLNPGALYEVMSKTWRRYKLPIIITENGLADTQDKHRQWFIDETIGALQKALTAGVDVRGYMHWSLLDNFEWAYGWWPEFGLIHVDRNTMRRSVRPSARWFADRLKRLH